MASAIYPIWKQEVMQGTANTSLTGDIRAIIVDTDDYTYSAAHDFLNDVAAGSRIGTTGALQNKSFTNGLFNADDISITGVTGDPGEAVVLYVHTGNEATARLVAYIDGITITPNGGNVDIVWHASGIFQL